MLSLETARKLMTTRPAVVWSALVAAYTTAVFLLSELGLELIFPGTDQPALWPAVGFAAGVAVVVPVRLRWVLAVTTGLASLTSGIVSGLDIQAAAANAIGDAIAPLIFAYLVTRTGLRLARPNRARTPVFYAAFAAGSAGAAAAIGSLAELGVTETSVWLSHLWQATAANTVGIVLLASVVVAGIGRVMSGELRLVRDGWQNRSIPAWTTVLVSAVVFSLPFFSEFNAVGFVVLPLLTWTATNSGQRTTSVVSMVVGVGAITLTTLGWGPFALEGSVVAVLSAQAFVLVTHLTAMALAIESESRRLAVAEFEGVLNSTADAVLVADSDLVILSANAGAAALLRQAVDSLVGSDLRVFFDGAVPRRGTMEITAGDETRVKVEVVTQDVETSHGLRTYLLHDLTQSRATQDALTRAFQVIDATPEMVAWFDASGSMKFLNDSGRSMLKLQEESFAQLTHDDLSPLGSTVLTLGISYALENDLWRGEVELRCFDETTVPADVSVIAHRDLDGQLSHTSIIARDLSDRLELDRLKDEFVSNITHELRTPLTAISGYIELFEEGALGELSENGDKAIQAMSNTSGRLLELVDDLLTLWRSERETSDEWHRFDISDAVEQMVESMRQQASRKGVTLTFEGEPIEVVGSESNVERAIMNLVSNAVKFTSAGGTVTVVSERTDDHVRVSVADTGIGIAASEQSEVFERFFRASSAEGASIPGTGLGLPIVREIAVAHGGDVQLQSVLGHGTFVLFEIPVAATDPSLEPGTDADPDVQDIGQDIGTEDAAETEPVEV